MRRAIWGRRAETQLAHAITYLAERNPDAAEALYFKIVETVDQMAVKPIGRPGKRPGTYEKRVHKTNYLIVYALPDDRPSVLLVLRVFHMAQDWIGWQPEPDDFD